MYRKEQKEEKKKKRKGWRAKLTVHTSNINDFVDGLCSLSKLKK